MCCLPQALSDILYCEPALPFRRHSSFRLSTHFSTIFFLPFCSSCSGFTGIFSGCCPSFLFLIYTFPHEKWWVPAQLQWGWGRRDITSRLFSRGFNSFKSNMGGGSSPWAPLSPWFAHPSVRKRRPSGHLTALGILLLSTALTTWHCACLSYWTVRSLSIGSPCYLQRNSHIAGILLLSK